LKDLAEAARLALKMITSGDPVLYATTLRTLLISATATALSSLFFIPAGAFLYFSSFPGKKLVTEVVRTLYGIPTVLVGMLVFLAVSRTGPLGNLGLLFTPAAIAIGEAILVAPIITGLTFSALRTGGHELAETALSLGAGRWTAVLKVLSEKRQVLLTTVLVAFGRAVSEVGIAVMVGGNIAGYTRTLTTSIVLAVGKGEVARSIALGMVLLLLALSVNVTLTFLDPERNR